MKQFRQKICFVVPEYKSNTPTHFNYLYDFAQSISKDFDLFWVAEKGAGRPDFIDKNKFYLQKFEFLPLRFLENLWVLFWIRLKGCKDFYVHYSFLSAFNASLIIKIFGGRTFYWNCGLPWLYRRNFFRDKFERSVYKLITFLVTGTEGLKKMYAEHYHLSLDKIKVMPNWIDLKKVESEKRKVNSELLRRSLNIPQNAKVLLFVHRLSKRKGAHYLPEILNQLKNENVFLLVVGDGPEREALNLQLTAYNLQLKTKFIGWAPQSEIINYFAIADVLILPSEEEGFPHVLLEAMAAGVPFAAFAVGGVEEICPPELAPYLADKGNLSLFIEKIWELLKLDNSSLEVLKQKELNWIRQFDIKFAVERFKKLINQINS